MVVHSISQRPTEYHNGVRKWFHGSTYDSNNQLSGGLEQPQYQTRKVTDCGEDGRVVPFDRFASSMRWFLDSHAAFEWPSDMGSYSGNHCHLLSFAQIPLVLRRRISDKRALIDEYEGDPRKSCSRCFVVKTIQEANHVEKAKREAQTMRGVRHPHCVILLGTFTYVDRLHLMIFPAARCDLRQLMKTTSRRLASRSKLGDAIKDHENIDVVGPGSDLDQTNNKPQIVNWELFPFVDSINILRRCFVCLSQGLDYLHASNIRHSDIRPDNILLDASGSVLLADCGISRIFPGSGLEQTSLGTPAKIIESPTPSEGIEEQRPRGHSLTFDVVNDQLQRTCKYAPFEMMKAGRDPRSFPSDIFSLGCVFLAIATLVLG